MHILIIALHRPLQPTGICRYAANLARCLADTEQVKKVTLVVGTWQKHYFATSFNLYSEKINLLGIDIKNSSVIRNLWYLFGLPKLAKQLKPDTIHLSFPLPFFRSLLSSPVVTTIHDLYPYECPENFGYPQVFFNQIFLKHSIYESDGLSCVSQVTLSMLKHYFPYSNVFQKCSVVYNYVDFSQILPKIPDGFTNEENAPFLLCVAQHRKNKNLDLLIESYFQLLERGYLKSSKLIIVGSSGPETDNISCLISKRSLQERVLMLSSISDRELCWLYKNCALFVIPSSTEGFCIPLVEALSLSCKVVCSDIPIFREVGSSQCIYFSLKDNIIENLVQAIVQSLNQSLIATNVSDTHFSKENAAIQSLEIYSKLTNSK
jgi:glycosyltransferase involved in cell wall biosynthesis